MSLIGSGAKNYRNHFDSTVPHWETRLSSLKELVQNFLIIWNASEGCPSWDIMDWNIWSWIPKLIKAYNNQYYISWGVLSPTWLEECSQSAGADKIRADRTQLSTFASLRGFYAVDQSVARSWSLIMKVLGPDVLPFLLRFEISSHNKDILTPGVEMWRNAWFTVICLSLRLKIDCLVDKLVCLLTSKKFFLWT